MDLRRLVMAISIPYHRICRQFTDGNYAEGGRSEYIEHPKYAMSPEHYVRAFVLLLKDLQDVLDYVEPADRNLCCYSYRIHELLLRACVEVEANCKAILTENCYTKSSDLNMNDYSKINVSHRLSSYELRMPFWHGTRSTRRPFSPWATGGGLPWYQAYNATKHDRHESFDLATLEQAIDAMGGLVVLISSQFYTYDFGPGNNYMTLAGSSDGMESSIGGYFRIRYPTDWPADQRYDFDWQKIKADPDPFAKFDYLAI
jgi:hypothetical protein